MFQSNSFRAAVLLLVSLFTAPLFAQGSLEKITVHGSSLEGNLNGDSADRDVYVYLPPGYASSNRRYPVIYFLHGYGVGAEIYVNGVLKLPASADAAMAGGAEAFIVVMPDAFNKYSGSMYSNSPTIGNWEEFVAGDLVNYIDSNYRTLATRESRGLAGHSMGGYGTMRIGMKRADTFGALYAMSACCLLNRGPGAEQSAAQYERMAAGLEEYKMGSFDNAMQAQAAAWAPNPDNPPYYLDFPVDAAGNEDPLIAGKWTANSPLVFVDQYVPALQSFSGIFLDVGNEDGLEATNTQLDAALTRLGVEHGYEIYQGDHGNRVGQRFIDNVLPFFAEHLSLR